LTDAVTALREEVARSYAHSQGLTQENEKLRAVVASLRRELAKGKGANKELKDHLQSLENRMRELRPPPLEPSTAPNAPAATAPGPNAPAAPPAGAAAGTGDGNLPEPDAPTGGGDAATAPDAE
jgi:cell division septum initiation protein DivIVA